MKFVLMCGGYYEQWETPKQLQVVNGERIVERIIRLLKENGVNDIVITSNDSRFDELGVPRLEHENSYRYENGKLNGYWVDAFYPKFRKNQKAIFIFGDVYFSEDAIKQIVEYKGNGNVLFGSAGALITNKVWGEPYAYVVNDMASFYDGIKTVKKLQDAGLTSRVPIVWELYRVLNGIDVNTHRVLPETYMVIDDETDDVDTPSKLQRIRDRVEKKGNVFTVFSLNEIGGGESWLYYMAKSYPERDITIYYQNANANKEQIDRLEKYARVRHYEGGTISCEKAFFNYNQTLIDKIEADEYYQVIHTNYKSENLTPKKTDKPIKYIAVSQFAADKFKEQTGLDSQVIYNPISLDKLDKPKKVRPLILMSATRLNSANKGRARMEKFARILEKNGIEFEWYIYTNDRNAIQNPHIHYRKPRLDITDYMPEADWFVQLSDDVEAFGYSVAEANLRGVPCITTPCTAFKEIGIQGVTVPFDLSKVPIEEIKNPPKVNYKAPKDGWAKMLSKKESNYVPPKDDDKIRIRITKRYKDIPMNRFVEVGEELIVTRKRMKVLRNAGVTFEIICEVR